MSQTNSPNTSGSKGIEGLTGKPRSLALSLLSKFILILALAANLSACRESSLQPGSRTDDRQILQAQQQRMIKTEVTGRAPVKELLPDDLEGLKHERFLLRLSNGSTVLVAHDISYAPRVPLAEGDLIVIHGEYIWNERGGLIHWTHRSDTPRHEGGWIDFKWTRYE